MSPPCPPVEDSVLGLAWPEAAPNSPATQPCPGGQQGEARWHCGLWGLRISHSPDYSDCTALGSLKSLKEELRDRWARPVEVLEEINQDLTSSEQSLAGGDIVSVVQLLDTAVTVQQAREGDKLEVSTNFVSASLQTVNNLGKNNITSVYHH